MKNDINFVKRVINEWDPIGLLCHAPEDEYCLEIAEIQELTCQTSDPEVLTEGIHTIFVNSFGKDVFDKSKEECKHVALSLLSQKV